MSEIEIGNLSCASALFFDARLKNDLIETQGVTTASLGIKVARQGTDVFEGNYVGWTWENSELRVANERFGMYPLFYTLQENQIRISPAIERILQGGVSRELDYEGLAVFFRMGHFIGERTPFRYIKVLPPNSVLTWKDGNLSIRSNESVQSVFSPVQFTFDEAVDEYSRLFQNAISKRLPQDSNFTVPLSGGRDSRHILLALHKEGVLPGFCPTAIYRPPASNEDARIASLLTRALGIKHRIVEKANNFHEANVRDVHLTNFCGAGHSWILPLAAHLKGNVNTIYDGLAGSVVSGGFLVDSQKLFLLDKNLFEDLALTILTEGGKEGFNQRVLTRSFARRIPIDSAVSLVSQELQEHAHKPNPLQSFVLSNRTRRGISSIPFSIMSHIPTVHCPYLDHELFDFLTNIDPSYSIGNKLHDETIKRAYPDFAHIPYEDKAVAARTSSDDEVYYHRSLVSFWRDLKTHGLRKPHIVRKQFLFPRVIYDLTKRHRRPPWYMGSSAYCLELESLVRTEM